jgi:hypothetical protein
MDSITDPNISSLTSYGVGAIVGVIVGVLFFYMISLYVQYHILRKAVRVGNEQAFQNRKKD